VFMPLGRAGAGNGHQPIAAEGGEARPRRDRPASAGVSAARASVALFFEVSNWSVGRDTRHEPASFAETPHPSFAEERSLVACRAGDPWRGMTIINVRRFDLFELIRRTGFERRNCSAGSGLPMLDLDWRLVDPGCCVRFSVGGAAADCSPPELAVGVFTSAISGPDPVSGPGGHAIVPHG
jgi:hypothetical protein